MKDQKRQDFYDQIKKSVEVLKHTEKNYGSIYLFTDPEDQEIKQYCKDQGCFNKEITLSRQYGSELSEIDILTEKIVQLKNFDRDQDIVLLDVDTLFKSSIPEYFWQDDHAVVWRAEYYITQFRNLDKVLPSIPWNEIGINFDESFIMYNTGVVFIPKNLRKQVCEKALWITDYLNNGKFLSEDRHGNRLDEQIGLSIAIHEYFGKSGKLKTCEDLIDHFWEEKIRPDGRRWWE
jgi:hypothetical protein